MENALRQEIVEKIFSDPILYGKVADALFIKPISLPYLLKNNHIKLTRKPVLIVIKKHLGVAQDSELLSEFQEAAQNT